MPTLHARLVDAMRAEGRQVREIPPMRTPPVDLVALWLSGTRTRLTEDLRALLHPPGRTYQPLDVWPQIPDELRIDRTP